MPNIIPGNNFLNQTGGWFNEEGMPDYIAIHTDGWFMSDDHNINFSASPLNSTPPSEISFENLTTVIPEEKDWSWDFGDGNTSTEENPKYIYYNPGKYSISFSGTINSELQNIVKEDYITIYGYHLLKGVSQIGIGKVLVEWYEYTNAALYQLQRAEDFNFTIDVHTVYEGMDISYTDDGLDSKKSYYYRLRAKILV